MSCVRAWSHDMDQHVLRLVLGSPPNGSCLDVPYMDLTDLLAASGMVEVSQFSVLNPEPCRQYLAA